MLGNIFGGREVPVYNLIVDCSLCADKWSPALQIRTVLLSIQALLSAPNPDDPLANDVAEQWKVNESKAIETGRGWGICTALGRDGELVFCHTQASPYSLFIAPLYCLQ